MRRLVIVLFVLVGLLAALSGCAGSEPACEEATRKGEGTHACFVEAHGGQKGAAEAEREEEASEIADEVEEVEEEVHQQRVEETAAAVRALSGE